jgi:cell division protein FtsA
MPKNKGKIVACLDLGTTKITCIIAAVNERKISILGYSYKKSQGVMASAISDMKLAQESISKVVSDAEKMAGFNIDRLVVGLSGSQISSQKKEVSNKISGSTVKNSDITNLARKVALEYKKDNREVVHLIPLQYKIDDSSYVDNPRYMTGNRIATRFHAVCVPTTTTKNIENCLKRCHLSVNNYVSESYCSALSFLNENEFNMGSLVIDFGGISTSFSVIIEGKLVYCGHVNVGGIHITRDISTILNVDFEVAEQIKRLNNSLIINPIEEKELIKMRVDSFSDNFGIVRITKQELKEIISCRIEEIVELVKKDLDKHGYGPHLMNNIVISGGVCSVIGVEKIVNQVFDRQSKVGYPQKVQDLPSELNDPSFASPVGMLIFLQSIYKREKNSEGFNSKDGLIKRLINYLLSL